jgi:hypothetical protein
LAPQQTLPGLRGQARSIAAQRMLQKIPKPCAWCFEVYKQNRKSMKLVHVCVSGCRAVEAWRHGLEINQLIHALSIDI